MSARPRPVTATFKPKSMAPPVGVRTRSYSLSSGSSTESLVSVLGHDSYESLSEVSDEEVTQCDCKVSFDDSQVKTPRKVSKSQHTSSDGKPTGKQAWKEWMVAKAKELREKQKREEMRLKKQQEEELKKQKEKEEKRKEAEEKIRKWMEAKEQAEKLNKKMSSHQESSKKETTLDKKKTPEEIAKKYEEWMKKKKMIEKEKKRREEEKKKQEEKEREEKERKSQEAYEKWLKKARTRPKSACSSLGYTCGKLTGYYDTCTYPMPTFINPLPWQPVEIPKPKPAKKRPKSAPKKRWNPDRYF